MCGPVMFCWSRRKWMSKVRGSTNASIVLPFTFMETWDLAMGCLLRSAACACFGAGKCARKHHAGHLGTVLRRSARVRGGSCDGLGGGHGFLHRCRVQR